MTTEQIETPVEPVLEAAPNAAKSSILENDSQTRPDELNLIDLLILVLERRNLVAKIAGVGTLAAVILALVLPARYTAATSILPPQQNQSLAAALSGQLSAMGPLAAMASSQMGLKNPGDLYVGMLKSRTVEDAIVWRFDLRKVYWDSRMSDARKDLEKNVSITSGKDGIISISVEDRDRKRAYLLANAYVEELRKLMQNVAVTEAGQRRLFFEQQVNEAKESLNAAELAFKNTQQKTGVIQLDGQARAIIEAVVRTKALIASQEVQLQAMRSYATDENPDLIRANQQLAALRAQLAKLETQQSASGLDLSVPTSKIPEAGLEYLRRMRDVKYYEAVFETLAKQYELARVEEAKQGAVVQVIDPAVVPDKKSSPKRGLIILGGFFLSLIIGCCWIVCKAALQRLPEVNPEQARRLATVKQLLTRHAQ